MIKSGVVRKIDDVGRIVIPKDIREHFGINPNSEIEFYITDDNKIKLIAKNKKGHIMEDLVRKEDVLKILYKKKEDISDNKIPINYGTILELIHDIRYMDKADDVDTNDKVTNIYTITTLEKVETDKNGWFEHGDSRVVGYYMDLDTAKEAVMNNACDINETVYDYAVIEKVKEGIFHPSNKALWFKYDKETDSYKPIDTPKEAKNACACGFSIG